MSPGLHDPGDLIEVLVREDDVRPIVAVLDDLDKRQRLEGLSDRPGLIRAGGQVVVASGTDMAVLA